MNPTPPASCQLAGSGAIIKFIDMNARNEKYILNVKINGISRKEVLDDIKIFLLSGSQHYIVTLNPEMVVEAQKNPHFKDVINRADRSIADGIGIIFANKFLNDDSLPQRIGGIDLMLAICASDFIKNKKIYLLGAGKGIAEKTAKVLRNKYPNVNIVGAGEGIPAQITNDKLQMTNKFTVSNTQHIISSKKTEYNRLNNELIHRINDAKPDVLFVAFGAPKQEMWIYENIKKIPSIRLAIGVGGSFDFISGKIKRAPRIMQKFGLEWLWRLIQEPKRINRICNATVKFSWLVLRSKIQKIVITSRS